MEGGNKSRVALHAFILLSLGWFPLWLTGRCLASHADLGSNPGVFKCRRCDLD